MSSFLWVRIAMPRRAWSFAAVLFLVVGPTPLVGQLRPGDEVRVRMAGASSGWVEGLVVGDVGDSLTYVTKTGATVTLFPEELDRLEVAVPAPRNPKKWAIAGGAAGAVVGGVLAAAIFSPEYTSEPITRVARQDCFLLFCSNVLETVGYRQVQTNSKTEFIGNGVVGGAAVAGAIAYVIAYSTPGKRWVPALPRDIGLDVSPDALTGQLHVRARLPSR